MTLGLQVHESVKDLHPERMQPVTNEGFPWVKPSRESGLWTSSFLAEGDYVSGWHEWYTTDAGWTPRETFWLLEPDPQARVFEVDSYEDLEALVDAFPHPDDTYKREYPDWEKVGTEFDAVHLTDAGQWATRLTHPLSLYGWDCESTLWFRWMFLSYRKAQDPRRR